MNALFTDSRHTTTSQLEASAETALVHCLFIGAGRFQLPVIEAARRRGWAVSALDGDPGAAGFALADRSAVADIRDREACLRIARDWGPDVVLAPATEAGAPSAAFIADALGLPGVGVDAARRATNKIAMRRAFAAAGLPSTDFAECRSVEEALEAYDSFGPAVVVKPVTGAGSRAVALVEDAADLPGRFDAARSASPGAAVVVERFMAGDEVAVEGYVSRGRFTPLLVSDKVRSTPPALLDVEIIYPSRRPAAEVRAICALAGAGAGVLGIDDAPVHVEIIAGSDGPRLVEIAARGAGFHVFDTIVPAVTGVDACGLQLDLASGREVCAAPAVERFARLDFPQARPGRVTKVAGLEAVRAMPGVLFAECFVRPGDVVRPLAAGSDRTAAIAVAADTEAGVEAVLTAARAGLIVETEPVLAEAAP